MHSFTNQPCCSLITVHGPGRMKILELQKLIAFVERASANNNSSHRINAKYHFILAGIYLVRLDEVGIAAGLNLTFENVAVIFYSWLIKVMRFLVK